jgi:hypothetical protein
MAQHEPQRKHILTQDVKESQIQHNRKNTPTQGCEKFSDQVKYQLFNHHGLHPLQSNILPKMVQVTDLSSNYKTNQTSDLVGVVEISGSTIRVNSTATKHIAESGTGHRPSIQLCTSKWSNHIGFHPLPTHVSIHIHARM